MRSDAGSTGCPDPETLAAFAEGKVARREMPALMAHLDRCRACRESLRAANDEINSRPRRSWIPAAAVASIAAAAVIVFGVLRPSPQSARLVQLAAAAERDVEPRLTGGFDWAPYRGPLRANDDRSADARRMQLEGVAGELLEEAERDRSPEAQRDAGLALLLIDDTDGAIARLRDAANRAPDDPGLWSDLAAARYAAALRHDRPQLYAEALSAVDHALRLDGTCTEALFNRALILERLGRRAEARAAWGRYLQVDAISKWAAEARTRLARLG